MVAILEEKIVLLPYKGDMMYKYSFADMGPECADYEFDFEHEKKFTQDQFKKICEDILIEILQENPKIDLDYGEGGDRIIIKKFYELGFTKQRVQAWYCFSSFYNDNENLKLKNLIQINKYETEKARYERMLEKDINHDDSSEYMKQEIHDLTKKIEGLK